MYVTLNANLSCEITGRDGCAASARAKFGFA
jgi:hypothetical protein